MAANLRSGEPIRVEARLENLEDIWDAERGRRTTGEVRSIIVPDAVVDRDLVSLVLPARMIRQLGLSKLPYRRPRWRTRPGGADAYGMVRLSVYDRVCILEVLEGADDEPVRVGDIPLTWMDLVVDTAAGTVIGNPAHGGEWMWEL